MAPARLLALVAAAPLALLLRPCCAAVAEVPPEHELLRYDVDLEAPLAERFAKVWEDFLARHGAAAFSSTYRDYAVWLAAALPELFGSPALARQTSERWLAALAQAHPDAVAELEAMSAALRRADPREPLFETAPLAAHTAFYIFMNIQSKNGSDTRPGGSACTSLVARQADGRVLHGRSLDYEPRDPLAAATVVLDYRRRNATAYRCLHVLQFPTAFTWFTCVRPGAFSLSVNARSRGVWTEHNTSFPELLRRVAAAPAPLLFGEAGARAMEAASYEAALGLLAASPVVSSNYYILAGAGGQGAIVTRYGNASAADVWALGSSASWSDGQPPWLRAQTNIDHWTPFESGEYATHRRQHAVNLIAGAGQGALSGETLLGVYLNNHAMAGSENRTTPEDTGVILRPSTIASLVLDPAAPLGREPDGRYWHVWARAPEIGPPVPEGPLLLV